MYFDGFGVERNFALAKTWWQKAAQGGHAGSLVNLGWLMYLTGNYQESIEWSQKAAARKEGLGQANLAFVLLISGDIAASEREYQVLTNRYASKNEWIKSAKSDLAEYVSQKGQHATAAKKILRKYFAKK